MENADEMELRRGAEAQMTGRRSALVLAVLLGTQGAFGAMAADQPASPSEASLRQRAEELARAASERFSEIMSGGRQPRVAEGTTPPQAQGAQESPGAGDEAFAPVWDWLARSAKDYDDVIIAKFRNPSGEVVILGPHGTVVAQQDTVPAAKEPAPSELPEAKPTGPSPGWSWGAVEEIVRDWLARANRSYRNEIVKKLKQPDTGTAWPPAEVVPQAPTPAEVAAEAEAERHAAEVRRAAEAADAQRRQEAEAQKQADEVEAKRKAEAESKRVADEAEAKRKAEAEAKRLADEAEAKRKADAEAKRVADEAEAKRKAEAESKRAADEAEAKHKAEAEAKRLADEAEAKRKAEAEAKRVADEAEAKRKADAEAKRVAEETEAKRKAEEKRLAEEAEAKRVAEAETARRLKEEAETERKAVAEAEAKRLASEAAAKRAAAEGRKPAHENSSVAVAVPSPGHAPEMPAVVEPERKARKEVLASEPGPAKIVKTRRRVVVAYEARPKKGKHGQAALYKHGHNHRYVVVEALQPKRIVHAYRRKAHAAPPLPVRSKTPWCACPHAYRAPAPKLHHARSHIVRHAYAAPHAVWHSCGNDSYFDGVPLAHHHKVRRRNLIFRRTRPYISPERR
jgi:hypothetical protein